LQCVAVCCSVLQCVAVCCSVLQCVAVCCSVLQCVAMRCSVLQCAGACAECLRCVCLEVNVTGYCIQLYLHVFFNVLPRVAVCCSVLQCVAVCCSVLQRVAVCCCVLQCVAYNSTCVVHVMLSHLQRVCIVRRLCIVCSLPSLTRCVECEAT